MRGIGERREGRVIEVVFWGGRGVRVGFFGVGILGKFIKKKFVRIGRDGRSIKGNCSIRNDKIDIIFLSIDCCCIDPI
jgi:hypothetical protein